MENQRPKEIKGYEHPTEIKTSRDNIYRKFDDSEKNKLTDINEFKKVAVSKTYAKYDINLENIRDSKVDEEKKKNKQ